MELHSRKVSHVPFPCEHGKIRLIKNPVNEDEILLMGGDCCPNISVYNIRTDKYVQLSDEANYKKIYKSHTFQNEAKLCYPCIVRIGMHSVLENAVLGHPRYLLSLQGNLYFHLAIFDALTLKWVHISKLHDPFDFMFHTFGALLHSYSPSEQYLILFGTKFDFCCLHTAVCFIVYKINIKYTPNANRDTSNEKFVAAPQISIPEKPKFIFACLLSKVYNKDYLQHGMVSLHTKNSLQILLFGGKMRPFFESFFNMMFRFGKKSKVTGNDFVTGVKNNPQDYVASIENDLKGVINKGDTFYSFTYSLVKKRFLVLVGGKIEGKDNDKIIYFDASASKKKWYISKVCLPPMEDNSYAKLSSIVMCNKYLHVVGSKYHHRFVLADIITDYDWIIERLIWIAYEKNERNELCYLKNISKDVIKHILSFLCYN